MLPKSLTSGLKTQAKSKESQKKKKKKKKKNQIPDKWKNKDQ